MPLGTPRYHTFVTVCLVWAEKNRNAEFVQWMRQSKGIAAMIYTLSVTNLGALKLATMYFYLICFRCHGVSTSPAVEAAHHKLMIGSLILEDCFQLAIQIWWQMSHNSIDSLVMVSMIVGPTNILFLVVLHCISVVATDGYVALPMSPTSRLGALPLELDDLEEFERFVLGGDVIEMVAPKRENADADGKIVDGVGFAHTAHSIHHTTHEVASLFKSL